MSGCGQDHVFSIWGDSVTVSHCLRAAVDCRCWLRADDSNVYHSDLRNVLGRCEALGASEAVSAAFAIACGKSA